MTLIHTAVIFWHIGENRKLQTLAFSLRSTLPGRHLPRFDEKRQENKSQVFQEFTPVQSSNNTHRFTLKPVLFQKSETGRLKLAKKENG